MNKKENKLPLIVICGRTNVGKSTLFNCLIEKNQALTSNVAGTTRDSNIGKVEWQNCAFDIIDTAGILDQSYLLDKKISGEDIDSQTQKQAKKYLTQADLILFLVDTKAGITPEDKALSLAIQKKSEYKKKTLLIANKIDNFKQAGEAAEFNKLGLGEPQIVSATTGLGTGDLLDFIVKKIGKPKIKIKDEKLTEEEGKINVCIVGKPNVGKSSLLNSILGYDRVIVSPIPHTTREPQNTEIVYKDKKINLIDTAGISRQGKKGQGFEKPGILKSLRSLDHADIALLVVDVSEPLTHQDSKIIEEIVKRQKSLIIVGNKWDRMETKDTKKWTEEVFYKFPFVAWAPLQFVSAKNNLKVNKILDLTLEVAEQRQTSLSASQSEKFLKHVVKIHKPAKGKGTKAPRIWEFRQIKVSPPVFIARIGANDDLHFSYVRFMENRLRERYGFKGTPIYVKVTKSTKSHTTYNE